jgi:ABC-2 type transport system ATP-binding protein
MPTVLASLQEVTKRFGDVEALRGVSVTLPTGVVGLLGPNGAGKSTLFRLLLGLDRPDVGEVRVLDLPVPQEAVRARGRIGYMPEDDSLFPDMTAIEQVTHAAQLSGVSAMDATPRAHQALDLVGLTDNRYRKAAGFSLGQRQRLRLAMALCHGPQLLIVDEPTAGLDPDGRAQMLALLAEIARQGASVLLSTHILADVEAVCSYVVLMTRGQAALDFSMNIYATHGIKIFEFLQRKRKELLTPYDIYLL